MVRVDKKNIVKDFNHEDVKITQYSIGKDQFLEVVTSNDVYLESIECKGMRIIAKNIYINGKIISHKSITLAAVKIFINQTITSCL